MYISFYYDDEEGEATKREVARAKEHAYEELYDKLETEAGQKELYRLAKQRERAGKDVQLVKVIKDENGVLRSSEEDVRQRWKNYFEKLMNEENEMERRENGGETVSSHVRRITKDEVKAAMKRMKHGKAVGPDDIPIEAWKALGDIGVNFLTQLFNQILEAEEMPEEWRKSILVPIYIVPICAQQFGFMPRKSTTDAIFALRVLMEKYREGKKSCTVCL